jgi:hypothetical protein
MKSLKSRIKRLEMAKKKSKGKRIIVVSTEPGREDHDLKKAKEKHGEKPDLQYVVTYVPEPDPLPERFKK